MAIVVRLDELLHARRMTLTELAARVDITLANLSILKTGKAKAIRFSTLEAICAALDAPLSEILSEVADAVALEEARLGMQIEALGARERTLPPLADGGPAAGDVVVSAA